MESTMMLTGYVGNTVDLKTTKNGTSFVNLRVATTPRLRRGDEWIDAPTVWTTVVCYRALADNVAASLYKGDPVIVEGKVRAQVWVDAQGDKHERTLVEAIAIGHDMNRGTSSFHRSSPRQPMNQPDENESAETESVPPKETAADEEDFEDIG